MNLKEISLSIEAKAPKTERELHDRTLEYCINNKIDFIEVSTVGFEWSKVNKYSQEVFYNKPFYNKGETIHQTNERLLEYIEKNYINKKDCVVWFSTFFGLKEVIFYDSLTHSSIRFKGGASEEATNFNKLIDIYHSIKN